MIIFKSLRNQLSVISVFFLIFVTLVMLQFYYSHTMQLTELRQLKVYHRLIDDYMTVEALENVLVDKLRAFADRSVQLNPEQDIPRLTQERSDWFDALQLWHAGLLRLYETMDVEPDETVFSKSFLENKQRQAENYMQILQLCREGEFKDALTLLNIEHDFRPGKQSVTSAILKSIDRKMESDMGLIRRFYIGTALALLVALVFLILVSMEIFRNITRNIRHLEGGAYRIARGDFSGIVGVESPEELVSLAQAFNEMQSAVKSRDDRIRQDNEEIRKLNESLEQKVFERNKTITRQNEALTRKNEELEQVLYAASHDLRTPLIGIQGFSEELKLTCAELVEKMKEPGKNSKAIDALIREELYFAVDHIINGSRRMGILLEGLLRISRMGRESLDLKRLNMNELVRGVGAGFDFQLNEIGAKLEIDDLLPCFADLSLFEQVFTNLIGNAIKYRSPERPLEIRISSSKTSDTVQYFVRDNGIGIDKANLSRIFHAFFRINSETSEGEGIGLAIVTRALDLHSGSVRAESTPGAGSTFIIELPLKQPDNIG